MMRHIALLILVCLFSGCRQPEGPVPQPSGEHVTKTEDITRALLAVARDQQSAPAELAADLENLTGRQPPKALVQELTARLQSALAGRMLTDEDAQKIARQLYIAIVADELSERQMDRLRQDVAGSLTA